jgi:hypothetical protein
LSAEIMACALGAVALILTWVVAAIGLLGVVDAVRFRSCDGCSRWTIASKKYGTMCRHCRPREQHGHSFASHFAFPLHLHRPHFGH